MNSENVIFNLYMIISIFKSFLKVHVHGAWRAASREVGGRMRPAGRMFDTPDLEGSYLITENEGKIINNNKKSSSWNGISKTI